MARNHNLNRLLETLTTSPQISLIMNPVPDHGMIGYKAEARSPLDVKNRAIWTLRVIVTSRTLIRLLDGRQHNHLCITPSAEYSQRRVYWAGCHGDMNLDNPLMHHDQKGAAKSEYIFRRFRLNEHLLLIPSPNENSLQFFRELSKWHSEQPQRSLEQLQRHSEQLLDRDWKDRPYDGNRFQRHGSIPRIPNYVTGTAEENQVQLISVISRFWIWVQFYGTLLLLWLDIALGQTPVRPASPLEYQRDRGLRHGLWYSPMSPGLYRGDNYPHQSSRVPKMLGFIPLGTQMTNEPVKANRVNNLIGERRIMKVVLRRPSLRKEFPLPGSLGDFQGMAAYMCSIHLEESEGKRSRLEPLRRSKIITTGKSRE